MYIWKGYSTLFLRYLSYSSLRTSLFLYLGRTKRLEELRVVVAIIFLQVLIIKSEHIGYDRRNFCPADSLDCFGLACFTVLNIDMLVGKDKSFQILKGVMLIRHVCSPP